MIEIAAHRTREIGRTDVEDFIYWEAELLDSGRLDEWLELFTAEATYWVPSSRGQSDPYLLPSHVFEDDLLRRVRVERFSSQYSHSLQPAPRSSRIISNVRLEAGSEDAPSLTAVSTFLVTQYHRDQTHRFAGKYMHRLVDINGQLKIAAKKIVLLDADGPQPDMLTIL